MPGLHSVDWYPVTPLPTLNPAVSQQLSQRPCRLYGFSLRETTGATAAIVQLLDGGDVNGADVCEVSLAPGQSIREWFGKPGLLIQSGLFLNVISGSVRGSIWPLLLTDAEIAKDEGGYA